jgi:hypothetical protein
MVLASPGSLLTPPPSSFPPEDPCPVLLSPNSTPQWEPDPAPARRQRLQQRESLLFIGTQFSNLYTAVDTSARGRVVVCLVFVCLVFVRKYVLGHSRVSQLLNLRLCLLRHLGFLTSPYASPTCRRRRLNTYRLLRRSTPGPPPIQWAHLLHLPASPRPPLYTSTMTT